MIEAFHFLAIAAIMGGLPIFYVRNASKVTQRRFK